METAETTPEQVQTRAPLRSRFGAALVAAQAAAVVAAAYAATVAITFFVPDETDYAEASLLKHELLAAGNDRKIVLVGGSNFAYGADSTIIRAATGCRVVNMGMNGYFGTRFMLEEVKPYLNSGDIVVLAWEYDSYYKSVDGTSTDLLMVTKANRDTFGFLTRQQKLDVMARYPFVAQQKAIRLMGDTYDGLTRLLGAGEDAASAADTVLEVETLSSFTPDGDLAGHVGKVWTDDLEDGLDISSIPPDRDILPLMQSFAHDMNAAGVRVLVSWSPIIDDFHDRHRAEIARLNAQVTSTPGLLVPRSADAFVFPPSQHFDTVYHLNGEGRAIRSEMLAEDIITQFGDAAFCNRHPDTLPPSEGETP